MRHHREQPRPHHYHPPRPYPPLLEAAGGMERIGLTMISQELGKKPGTFRRPPNTSTITNHNHNPRTPAPLC